MFAQVQVPAKWVSLRDACPALKWSTTFTISCQNCLLSHKMSSKKSVLGYVPCSQVMHYFPNLELLATCSQYQVIHLLHTFYFLARPPSYLLSLNIFGIHHFNFWVYSEVIHNLHDFNFLALLTSNLLFAQFWSLGWLSSDPSFAQINFVTRFQSSFPSCLNAEKKKTYHQTVFYDFLRFFKL